MSKWPPADRQSPTVERARVLVVDDDDFVREVIVSILQLAGFDVVEAGGGAEGLKILRADRTVCLVLLDLMMPDMDGWRFRHEQREDPRLAEIPTVIITGGALSADLDEQLKAADYLAKPVEREVLVSVAARYCQLRQQARPPLPDPH